VPESKTFVIDLHAHVLPGIDDGPVDQEASLALLEAAARDGTRVIAATPHLRRDFPNVHVERIAADCAQLRTAIPVEWELELVSGAEVDLVWALDASDEQLRMASYGGRGTDVLIETPYGWLPPTFEAAVLSVVERGYRVLLAHPELSQSLQERPGRLGPLVDWGVLVQVSAGSLLRHPKRSRSGRCANELIASGMGHVIASDAHSSGPWRPPGLAGALTAVRKRHAARANWMVTSAPAAILGGTALPPPS
jgi:protein-tyrosine phosphatase